MADGSTVSCLKINILHKTENSRSKINFNVGRCSNYGTTVRKPRRFFFWRFAALLLYEKYVFLKVNGQNIEEFLASNV